MALVYTKKYILMSPWHATLIALLVLEVQRKEKLYFIGQTNKKTVSGRRDQSLTVI